MTVWPEKLFTRDEVDVMLEKREDRLPSLAKQIKEESQTKNRQKRQSAKTVANLVSKSNRILAGVSSRAFPFDLFPNTINIEEGRITIIKRHFLSSEVHSVDIKDISNVFINTTIFRSQLVIISRTFEENEIKIKNLRTGEAVFARRLIEGLRVFEDKQIDTSGFTKDELVAKLEELSTTQIVT